MTLTWSMDKIGPICRHVEDCAVVLGAIHGADQRDPASVDRPFSWPAKRTRSSIRVGYVPEDSQFATEIDILRELGFNMVPIEVPQTPHEDSLSIILTAESAAVFDELTRRGEPKGVKNWPKSFVKGQFITAVDYLRANRVRRRVMENMHQLMHQVDVVVGASMSLTTNLTGHPKIAVPRGFEPHKKTGLDVSKSLSMTGRLYDETTLLTVANAFQQATTHHLRRPNLEKFLAEKDRFHRESDLLDNNKLYTE